MLPTGGMTRAFPGCSPAVRGHCRQVPLTCKAVEIPLTEIHFAPRRGSVDPLSLAQFDVADRAGMIFGHFPNSRCRSRQHGDKRPRWKAAASTRSESLSNCPMALGRAPDRRDTACQPFWLWIVPFAQLPVGIPYNI